MRLASASHKIAELEATGAQEQKQYHASYLEVSDERMSWRRQALDEKGGAQAAAAVLDPLRCFFEDATKTLELGAEAAREMRWTHDAVECRAILYRTWEAVGKAGEAALGPHTKGSPPSRPWLAPLQAAARSYTEASLRLAHEYVLGERVLEPI
mmetsp:Transcript_32376/g.84930  ORF Transcript_32376/g.84930 Transcript_32376/m.84930 type:complete len:154 (+) Transcript_32376:3-464(+)